MVARARAVAATGNPLASHPFCQFAPGGEVGFVAAFVYADCMAAKTPNSPDRIGRLGQSGRLVVPRELLEALNLQIGDSVAFSRKPSGLLIGPKPALQPDDVLTPAEANKTRHALQQARQGKTKPWRQVKHELVCDITKDAETGPSDGAKANSEARGSRPCADGTRSVPGAMTDRRG
jgi:antitoxin component of MazEF toxin-antitoxin module